MAELPGIVSAFWATHGEESSPSMAFSVRAKRVEVFYGPAVREEDR
jgi:hypothetical protein